jgi:hypothetical protein
MSTLCSSQIKVTGDKSELDVFGQFMLACLAEDGLASITNPWRTEMVDVTIKDDFVDIFISNWGSDPIPSVIEKLSKKFDTLTFKHYFQNLDEERSGFREYKDGVLLDSLDGGRYAVDFDYSV